MVSDAYIPHPAMMLGNGIAIPGATSGYGTLDYFVMILRSTASSPVQNPILKCLYNNMIMCINSRVRSESTEKL